MLPNDAESYLPLLKECYEIALNSPDLSTQNGAILVSKDGYTIGRGCNSFPHGLKIKPERLERPLKYDYTTHAERKALFQAAQFGFATAGSTLICPWSACSNCANAIIEMGVTRLVTHKDSFDRSPDYWMDSIKVAFDMLEEAGIEILWYKGYVGAKKLLRNGEYWSP